MGNSVQPQPMSRHRVGHDDALRMARRNATPTPEECEPHRPHVTGRWEVGLGF